MSPRIKRDCTCPRAKHVHGTVDAYTRDTCRCAECTEAQRIKLANVRRLIAYGRWEQQWHSPQGMCRRLQALAAHGYTDAQVAKKLGVDPAWVQRIVTERAQPSRTRTTTVRKVARVFTEMLDGPPPKGRRADAARARARRYGWVSVAAWDDIDTDLEPRGVAA